VSARPDEGVRQPRLYLDTSAYLTLLVRDGGWERLSDEIAGAELLSSVLLVLETKRNLVRLAREGTLKPEQYKVCVERVGSDASSFTLRDLSLDICSPNVLPAVSTPRSLDLAHLRTALWFHAAEPLDRFLTLDVSQEEAARELGLPV
jgi:hypothetical protein